LRHKVKNKVARNVPIGTVVLELKVAVSPNLSNTQANVFSVIDGDGRVRLEVGLEDTEQRVLFCQLTTKRDIP